MAALLQSLSKPTAQRRHLNQYISIATDETCSFAALRRPIHLLPGARVGPARVATLRLALMM